MTSDRKPNYDCIIAGGGLQAGLLAIAFHHYQPQSRILIVEKEQQLFGNHTWSFNETDIPESARWLNSIPHKKWSGYYVNFPEFTKRMNLGYRSFSSADLSRAVHDLAASNIKILTGRSVSNLSSTSVTTDCGERFESELIIDCRGVDRSSMQRNCGYQKFVGLEVELGDRDWPEEIPTLMDATIEQRDGFRFLYCLPFTRRRVLIEDTCFSNTPDFQRSSSKDIIGGYLTGRGFENWNIVREESGCLPMPFGSQSKPTVSQHLEGGYRGGWFHAATGYSFPLAANLANEIASNPIENARQRLELLARQNQFQASFSRFLNRMLFQLVAPNKRFQIFRRFYRTLNEDTISRFYAHQFTMTDAARILIGMPPQGLTPFRFLKSFRGVSCPALAQ